MSEPAKPNPLSAPDPWNLVADDYTLELLPMFELYSNDALELAPTPAGARVLDVAAGPGTLTLLAAKAGRSVSTIDFSPQMVTNLRKRLSDAELAADVRLGDGQALPWGDAEFAAAFSMFGLMFFPDRGRGFSELRRVLAPGGVAVVSSWAPFEGVFKSVMAAMAEALPDMPFGKSIGPLGEPEGFAEEMRSAGFVDVRIETRSHSLPGDIAGALWASFARTSAPIVLLRHRLGEAQWIEVSRTVVERLEAQYGKQAIEVRSTAYLGVGRKP